MCHLVAYKSQSAGLDTTNTQEAIANEVSVVLKQHLSPVSKEFLGHPPPLNSVYYSSLEGAMPMRLKLAVLLVSNM